MTVTKYNSINNLSTLQSPIINPLLLNVSNFDSINKCWYVTFYYIFDYILTPCIPPVFLRLSIRPQPQHTHTHTHARIARRARAHTLHTPRTARTYPHRHVCTHIILHYTLPTVTMTKYIFLFNFYFLYRFASLVYVVNCVVWFQRFFFHHNCSFIQTN